MAGRSTHEPTEERRNVVRVLSGGGISQDLIALSMHIDTKTLRKHYRYELDTARVTITGQAIAALVKAMQAGGRGSVGAAAFWLKCREGWKETSVTEHAGSLALESPAELLARRIDSLASRLGAVTAPEGTKP